MIAHISVDGNWTVSRSLRQQCDDVVQIDGTQLRPYVELMSAADRPLRRAVPDRRLRRQAADQRARRERSRKRPPGAVVRLHRSHPAPPAIYTAPVVAEYQPPARPAAGQPPAPSPPQPGSAAGTGSSEPGGRGMHRSRAAGNSPSAQAPQPFSGPSPFPGPPPGSSLAPPPQGLRAPGRAIHGRAIVARPGNLRPGNLRPGNLRPGSRRPGSRRPGGLGCRCTGSPICGSFRDPAASSAPALPSLPAAPPARDLPAAQHGAPGSAPVQAHLGRDLDPLPPAGGSGEPGCRAASGGAAPGIRSAGGRAAPPVCATGLGRLGRPGGGPRRFRSARAIHHCAAKPAGPPRRVRERPARRRDARRRPAGPARVSGRTPGGGQHGLHAAARFL